MSTSLNCALCGKPVIDAQRGIACCACHMHGTLTLEQALSCLSPKAQMIYVRHQNGEGWTAIAKQVGLSYERVRQVYFRAERFVQRMVGEAVRSIRNL